MYDLPAALLVGRLYEELSTTTGPAIALHRAQTRLTRLTTAELMEQTTTQSTQVAEAVTRLCQSAAPGARPFEHPIDWGAFTYLGP